MKSLTTVLYCAVLCRPLPQHCNTSSKIFTSNQRRYNTTLGTPFNIHRSEVFSVSIKILSLQYFQHAPALVPYITPTVISNFSSTMLTVTLLVKLTYLMITTEVITVFYECPVLQCPKLLMLNPFLCCRYLSQEWLLSGSLLFQRLFEIIGIDNNKLLDLHESYDAIFSRFST